MRTADWEAERMEGYNETDGTAMETDNKLGGSTLYQI